MANWVDEETKGPAQGVDAGFLKPIEIERPDIAGFIPGPLQLGTARRVNAAGDFEA